MSLATTGGKADGLRLPGELDGGVPDLVVSAQGGDHRSFERLYRLHVGRVYALCLRLVADAEQAEGLTQDAFVRAWQKLSTYRARGTFIGWLCRLAVNVVIEDRRARARRAKWLEFSPEMEAMEHFSPATRSAGTAAGDPSRGAAVSSRTELVIDLERAIAGLPPGARLAFVLHDVNGYRHREIAEMTGVATGTVKAQLHRARRLLRKALTEPGEAPEP